MDTKEKFSSNREGLYYPIITYYKTMNMDCMDLILIVKEDYQIFLENNFEYTLKLIQSFND